MISDALRPMRYEAVGCKGAAGSNRLAAPLIASNESQLSGSTKP